MRRERNHDAKFVCTAVDPATLATMRLRLAQWPDGPSSDGDTLLSPASLIEALGDSDGLEWVVLDTTDAYGRRAEELWISGGGGTAYIEVMGWYRDARRIPTPELLRALREGAGLQLIWGELRAFERGRSGPVVSIAGFDSTWYDIEGRADLVARIEAALGRARFKVASSCGSRVGC